MIALVVLLIIGVSVVAFFALPRGRICGRSALLPGQTLEFSKTSVMPVLRFISETTLHWRGREWGFALVRLPGGTCRAYIVQQPSYGDRPTNLHDTHRLLDRLGRSYVCWTPEPTSPDRMASVLALWVAATSRYLDTGDFPAAPAVGDELSRSSASPRGGMSDSLRVTRR